MSDSDVLGTAFVTPSTGQIAVVSYEYIAKATVDEIRKDYSGIQKFTPSNRVSCWFTVPELSAVAVNIHSRATIMDSAHELKLFTSTPGFVHIVDASGDTAYAMPQGCTRNKYLVDTRTPVLLGFDGAVAINCANRTLFIASASGTRAFRLRKSMEGFTIEASARDAPVVLLLRSDPAITRAVAFNYLTGESWDASWVESSSSSEIVFSNPSRPALSPDGSEFAVVTAGKLNIYRRP